MNSPRNVEAADEAGSHQVDADILHTTSAYHQRELELVDHAGTNRPPSPPPSPPPERMFVELAASKGLPFLGVFDDPPSRTNSGNLGHMKLLKKNRDKKHSLWNRLTRSNLLDNKHAIKTCVLLVLCLQNSMFTVLRRYSHGVLREAASKYEMLFVAEIVKLVFSAIMIKSITQGCGGFGRSDIIKWYQHLIHVASQSKKMFVLAIIYGAMNVLSFVSLRNIGAGMFTIIAQAKILTTATFSTILLERRYSATKWRALVSLSLGVLLSSEPIWGAEMRKFAQTGTFGSFEVTPTHFQQFIGILAVLIEVTLSGFASIYFEKVVKNDSPKMNIWERNFQLAVASSPVYCIFILFDKERMGASVGGGWSSLSFAIALLGAAGGLLVALSIKYGDAMLKTLSTTGAIVLSSLLDWMFLGGPLTPVMVIAGIQVILAIFDYTFDKTPPMDDPGSHKKLLNLPIERSRGRNNDARKEEHPVVNRHKSFSAFSRVEDEEKGLSRPLIASA